MSGNMSLDVATQQAGAVLTALREIAVERREALGGSWLTDSDLRDIDDIIDGLGYKDGYCDYRAGEWKSSLNKGLFNY